MEKKLGKKMGNSLSKKSEAKAEKKKFNDARRKEAALNCVMQLHNGTGVSVEKVKSEYKEMLEFLTEIQDETK